MTIRVLVADDHANARQLLGMFLRMNGYEPLFASNGIEALTIARSEKPHAIVMDIFMPVMDGLEATRALKASSELQHIPVIAHTAMPQSLAEHSTLFYAVLTKPCSPAEVVACVEQVLGTRSADRPCSN